MRLSRKAFGTEGERIAALHLEKKGYTVVSRNFYTRFGEIDLIVSRPGELIFVEVKTRTPDSAMKFGRGALAVDHRKQTKISRSAAVFLEQNPKYADFTYRFDVVEVYRGVGDHWDVRHTEDAFDPVNGIYI